MSYAKALMLVSAWVDDLVRSEVSARLRPKPEYLVLEETGDVEVLDWSQVPGSRRTRSVLQSALHVGAAMRRLREHQVVFSDGEHIGIPLAMAMRGVGAQTRHLVIGHRLSSRSKARLLRDLGAHLAMTRILVHSPQQRSYACRSLGIPDQRVAVLPYGADTAFWQPLDFDEERLVVSAGREHRDYTTLAAACDGEDYRVVVASGSVHSPAAGAQIPTSWPSNFDTGFADYRRLRELYARASVVVVPVVATDFQAGVTTVLEAMAMGKAVVTSNATAQGDVLRNGITGIAVRTGDAGELRDVIRCLMSNRAERARLGAAARDAVLSSYTVESYASRLAGHLAELKSLRFAA